MSTPPHASSKSRIRQADPSRRAGRRARRLAIEALEPYVLMAVNVFNVTTSLDSGDGSLRAAMTQANLTAGPSEIDFKIPGNGPVRIFVGSASAGAALPTIGGTLFINGYSEGNFQRGVANYAGPPLVAIDGRNAQGTNGFDIGPGVAPNANSNGSKIQGLVIDHFNDSVAAICVTGIVIEPSSTGDVVSGNYIGIDFADGSSGNAGGNSGNGVLVQSSGNTIGGVTPADRNVISGNLGAGVMVRGGSSGTPLAPPPLINNVIEGNFIGTDLTGSRADSNAEGVMISGTLGTTVGGATAAAGNVISGNADDGVCLSFDNRAATSDTVIQSNFIGTNAAGTAALGNKGFGIENADADHTLIGGIATTAGVAPGNLISGNGSTNASGGSDSGGGVELSSTSSVAPATTGVVIQGNLIGTNRAGTSALPNVVGVVIAGSPSNTVGGTSAGARNVISGNGSATSLDGSGVIIIGTAATGNVIQGNYIGADITGNAPLGNYGRGVYIGDASDLRNPALGVASGDTIGGSTFAAANVIVANGLMRIESGVELRGRPATTTAPFTPAVPTTHNLVQDNRIGVYANFNGSAASGNGADGVHAQDTANSQIIANRIANNRREGMTLQSTAETAVGSNRIDDNGDRGVSILGTSTRNAITSNEIAGNAGSGIGFDQSAGSLTATNGNLIIRNFISGNKGIGIAFHGNLNTPTPNTPGVHTSGPNLLQNYPVLVSTSVVNGDVIVHGTLTSAGPGPFIVELFSNPAADPSGHGQGQTFLASAQVTLTNGAGTFDLNLGHLTGGFLAATATDASRNTSEFSADLKVSGTAQVPTITTLTSSSNPSAPNQTVTFTALVTAQGGGTPAGLVALFVVGSTVPFATRTLDRTGHVTFDAAGLPLGTTSFRADYAGASGFRSSMSPIVNQVVKATATTTTLTSTPNPSNFGQSVTFTVTVTPAGPTPDRRAAAAARGKGKAAQAVAVPTGAVRLLEGMDPIGMGTLDATGHATIRLVPLFPGTNSIVASYSGDGNFAFSQSPVYKQVVNPVPSTTAVVASTQTAMPGQPITLTATVARQHDLTPTGTVRFLDGQRPLGASALDASGQATLTVSTLGVGSHTITAVYGGDANFTGSRATVGTIVINPATGDGPRVTGLVRYGFHAQPTIFVLAFNGPLDPARAENPLNYTLVGPVGGLGRGGKPLAIGAAIYDAAARTVTLLPVHGLNVHGRYTLRIHGTGPLGVAGPTGLPLDGAGTGQAGSDYVTTFGRSILVGPARAYSVPIPGRVEQVTTRRRSTAAVDSLLNSGALHVQSHRAGH